MCWCTILPVGIEWLGRSMLLIIPSRRSSFVSHSSGLIWGAQHSVSVFYLHLDTARRMLGHWCISNAFLLFVEFPIVRRQGSSKGASCRCIAISHPSCTCSRCAPYEYNTCHIAREDRFCKEIALRFLLLLPTGSSSCTRLSS
jgi:hypothetical protein